jgi:hypothetical protein
MPRNEKLLKMLFFNYGLLNFGLSNQPYNGNNTLCEQRSLIA